MSDASSYAIKNGVLFLLIILVIHVVIKNATQEREAIERLRRERIELLRLRSERKKGMSGRKEKLRTTEIMEQDDEDDDCDDDDEQDQDNDDGGEPVGGNNTSYERALEKMKMVDEVEVTKRMMKKESY